MLTRFRQQWCGKESQMYWAKDSGPETLDSTGLESQDPGIHIFNAFPDDFDTGDFQTTFCETLLLDKQEKVYILGNLEHLLSEPCKWVRDPIGPGKYSRWNWEALGQYLWRWKQQILTWHFNKGCMYIHTHIYTNIHVYISMYLGVYVHTRLSLL